MLCDARSVLALLLIGLILAESGLLIVIVRIVLLIFAGVLFGVLLSGLSRWISQRTNLSYTLSFSSVVALLCLMCVMGLGYLGAQVQVQVSQLWNELDLAAREANERFLQHEMVAKSLEGGELSSKLLTSGQTAVGTSFRWFSWTLTGLVVILFVGLYVGYDPALYKNGFIRLVPRERRARARVVLQKLGSGLERWIIGRMVSMALIGICTMLGLWLLGVPQPVALGVLAGLLTFLPNFGPVLAAVPQALLALKAGSNTVIYVVAFNAALQGIESYVITPTVQQFETSLPPALTISVQLVMGAIAGMVGVMMAAPLAVVGILLVQTLYVHDYLGDAAGRLGDD